MNTPSFIFIFEFYQCVKRFLLFYKIIVFLFDSGKVIAFEFFFDVLNDAGIKLNMLIGCNSKKLELFLNYHWTQPYLVYNLTGYEMAVKNTGTLVKRSGCS